MHPFLRDLFYLLVGCFSVLVDLPKRFRHSFKPEDLKPMNLLLTDTLEVKVSDFGTGILESPNTEMKCLASC